MTRATIHTHHQQSDLTKLPNRPFEPGRYMVTLIQIGTLIVKYIDGSFYFDNGVQISDNIILGWK